jgi:serine/threonine-protein kinase RsbT
MQDELKFRFVVDGDDFTSAGEASGTVKKTLHQLGIDPAVIRRAAIAMYEGEINMVIHAFGGVIDVYVNPERIRMVLKDKGPGIPDVEMAMKEGFSTADDKVRGLGFGAGMGLPNMRKYTDEMIISTKIGEGTTVDITVNII